MAEEMIGYFARITVNPVGSEDSRTIEIIARKPSDIDVIVKNFEYLAADFNDPYTVPIVIVDEAKRIIFREEE